MSSYLNMNRENDTPVVPPTKFSSTEHSIPSNGSGSGSNALGHTYTYYYEQDPNNADRYTVTVIINTGSGDITITYGFWDGQVHLYFEETDFEAVRAAGGLSILATAMIVIAQDMNPIFLSGRTVNGVVMELEAHWQMYVTGINPGNKASPVDIGTIYNNFGPKDGYDYNAIIWERLANLGPH